MDKIAILWVDDEIDLLKPHIMFLQEKGYDVATVNNGHGAIDMIKTTPFDIVFLDEQMPGLSGIETLLSIKTIQASLPVVMITKSEEESIMERCHRFKYCGLPDQPVKPNQILLCLKKKPGK